MKWKNDDKKICHRLLRTWSDKLLELQVKEIADPDLRGGILCPACGRIHGRCLDAIYPFLYMADKEQEPQYLEGAKLLFAWAERCVSREDGSYLNDTNSDWKGTTVFAVIQLIEALQYHGHLLDEETYRIWKERAAKGAEFLYSFHEFEVCNINYCSTNCLAMELCGRFFEEEKYQKRGQELADLAFSHLTDSGLLYGEGRPTDGLSPKGCRSVDVGYNVEESLPSLVQYVCLTGDEKRKAEISRALRYHSFFFVDDGGIDNSFGTRNYKWTYWGSRTSDGCALGYLQAADWEPDFGTIALKNLRLLEKCTCGGFLFPGPGTCERTEPACIHHMFSRAKVLAGILDRGLERNLQDGTVPRMKQEGIVLAPELDTYFVTKSSYTATVTGYDWEYLGLPEGHASGGTLSFFWHQKAGLLLCASMCRYNLREANNMQLPRFSGHQCITPRLEYDSGGTVYSSMYDYKSVLTWENTEKETVICVRGSLTDIQQNRLSGRVGEYLIKYYFEENGIRIFVKADLNPTFLFPVVIRPGEKIDAEPGLVRIKDQNSDIRIQMKKGISALPNGPESIYNLVPGVEALNVMMQPDMGEIEFFFSF